MNGDFDLRCSVVCRGLVTVAGSNEKCLEEMGRGRRKDSSSRRLDVELLECELVQA